MSFIEKHFKEVLMQRRLKDLIRCKKIAGHIDYCLQNQGACERLHHLHTPILGAIAFLEIIIPLYDHTRLCLITSLISNAPDKADFPEDSRYILLSSMVSV